MSHHFEPTFLLSFVLLFVVRLICSSVLSSVNFAPVYTSYEGNWSSDVYPFLSAKVGPGLSFATATDSTVFGHDDGREKGRE